MTDKTMTQGEMLAVLDGVIRMGHEPGESEHNDLELLGVRAAIAAWNVGDGDKGPWHVGKDGKDVFSADFAVDAALRISGDFRDDDHRRQYAEWLCNALNTLPTLSRAAALAQLAKQGGERGS